jgi:anti-sigma-K factor RskA
MNSDDHSLVGAYVTDALADNERALFEEHLAGCQACTREVWMHSETLADLASGLAVTPPVHLAEGILGPAAEHRHRRVWSWLGAVAAAVAIFAAGALVGRQTVPELTDAHIVALASAPDAQLISVDMMGTHGTVVKSQAMGEAAFLAADLPTPAKGMCYQIWKVAPDGSKTSAGLVVPDSAGHVAVVLDTSGVASSYVITLEPPGGSKEPTGEMVGQADV